MLIFVTGLALFFGPHMFSAIRSRAEGEDLRAKNQGLYMGIYSLISLAGFDDPRAHFVGRIPVACRIYETSDETPDARGS